MEARASSAVSVPTTPLVDKAPSKAGPAVLFGALTKGRPGFLPSLLGTYAYDPAGQLTQILHRKTADNTALAWANYAYDPAGNRTSMTDHAGTHAYGYDDLHRLISAEHPSGSNVPTKSEVFDYDRAGNRLFDANITAYQYDAANRLLENSSFTYAYDGNGNQTHKISKATGEDTEYVYSSENQLIEVKVGTSSIARFQYDGLGRRIEKSTGPVGNMTPVRYVYYNEDILAMLDENNSLIALFTHGPGIDEPNILKEAGGPEYFFHADALGSIVGLTDTAGELVERVEYEAYGKPQFVDPRGGTPVTGDRSFTGSAFAFTAREWDASSGLYFYRARYYSPRIGRFLQENANVEVNPFAYVANRPTISVDPDGHRIMLGPLIKPFLRKKFNPYSGMELAEQYIREEGGVAQAHQRAVQERDARRGESVTPQGHDLRVAEHYLYAYYAVGQGFHGGKYPTFALLANGALGWEFKRALEYAAGIGTDRPPSLDALFAGYVGLNKGLNGMPGVACNVPR